MSTPVPIQVPANPAVVVRISADDYLAVATAAQQEGRSMASYVRHIVRQHLAAAA